MKKEERLRRESKSSIVEHNDRIYFNDEWYTESPTDDDEGLTISDEDGYEDGIDSFPTKKKPTIEDGYEEYGN